MKLVCVTLVALFVAGCGGTSGGAQTGTTLSLSTANTASIPSGASATPARAIVSESVRGVSGAGAWGTSVTAGPGQAVQFRTLLGQKGGADVSLVFAWGHGKGVTATATVNGHSSRTTVVSATAAHLTLVGLHYTCAAPPAPSFCPIHTVSTTRTATLAFHAPSPAAIVVAATVGPVVVPGITTISSGSAGTAAGPYKLLLAGRTVLPSTTGGPSVSSPFQSPVPVKPGDILVVAVHARGVLNGAPQRVNVSLAQGPGTSLTASASVAGRNASQLRIKSSNGSPVILAVPRYICFAPPAPTYCPPLAEAVSGGSYSFSFLAAPRRPPITLLATVAQG